MAQFWVIIYIISELNFYEKNPETLLTQFLAIVNLIFMKITKTLLTQFWVITYIISEFNFHENFRI